jgi:hypothetical protein
MGLANAGFWISIGNWLRGHLPPREEALLNLGAAQQQDFLPPEPIPHLWHHHLSGLFNHTSHLWMALMSQAGLEE